MVLQAVHLIKGLNASEIALLRANMQQFKAYNREKDFPFNKSFSTEHVSPTRGEDRQYQVTP